ncbi:MAG: AMP-binding protein [Chloroflexia bacterium]
MLGVSYTHRNVFDLHNDDIYWCAADIGWVTGHLYIVYGPLANGATSVMYEGTPDHPGFDRWWAIIEKYKVNIPLLRADGDSRAHEVGRAVRQDARSLLAAAARVGRRADRPGRRGSGTTRTSAMGTARSSIPGGRPRPARS